MLKLYEKIPRTVSKIVSWRIVMTLSQFVGGWLVSGNLWVGVGMIGYSAIVNSLIYYVHERAWNRVQAGREILEVDQK